jgi:integrase
VNVHCPNAIAAQEKGEASLCVKLRRLKDAQDWLDKETAKMQTGTWIAPRTAKITVEQRCDQWLANYATKRPSSVRMAGVYCTKIKNEFGHRRLDSIRPSEIRAWLVKLKGQGLADSYLYLLHTKFAQLYNDAIHDGLVVRSPLSRRTSPPKGRQRLYVATTEQIWALHDAMGGRYRAGLLLGAFAGLRVSEVCGLRVSDIDFLRGVIHPVFQHPAEELKSETSRTPIPIPIPKDLVLQLSRHVEDYSGQWVMSTETGGQMGPWALQALLRSLRVLWRDCRRDSGSMTSDTSMPRC